GPDDIAWDYSNSLLSPVSILYPPRETLFDFELRNGQAPRLEYTLDRTRRAIFGIRPCDTHAVVYLDRFLAGGAFEDSQYKARRENAKLVTIACAEPATPNCWCSCCEGGPVASEGFDVQLSPLGDFYLVEVAEGGVEIADAWSDLLEPADERAEDLIAARDEQVERTKQALELNAHIGAAMRRITAGALPAGFWQDIGARCIGCGGCSFVCPKCTCFNVVDQMLTPTAGRRIREKDSCRFAGYSLEASGHNPRPERADRAKRWSYHKLSYRYVERNNYHGCVGCGRCVTVCVGRVDMPTVAKQIREVGRSATASAAG
ncbi:MAG: 4Fe-4S dicluster domain-containing protein, partial [Armatimonadetes bacterium]|nr:4Fe-4S dicluster domain-containing protein [Armatimonadota bacterium]